jgi:Protein of unknown function (DUF2281)
MNLVEQIAKLSRELPQQKQEEVLDFVEFLTSRQARKTWTVDERQSVATKTMGCLAGSRTGRETFAERKREEEAKEDRSWRP